MTNLHSPLPGSGRYSSSGITLLDEHLGWMRRCGRSERTVRARRMTIVLLAEWLGHDPATATEDELDRWQASIPSIATLRRQTSLIRVYYAWLHGKGIRSDNPAMLLPMPRQPHRLPRPMPEHRVAAAIAHAPGRLLPWLLVAGWCGLRAEEIASMKVAHFRRSGVDGRVWLRVVGKGEHVREVPVPEWLWQVLEPMLPDEGYCWRMIRRPRVGDPVSAQHVTQYANKYLRSQDIPDTLHSLRHRIATIALRESGGDLRLVQMLLGHLSIQTTTQYTAVEPTALADVLDRIPPPDGFRVPTGPTPIRRTA